MHCALRSAGACNRRSTRERATSTTASDDNVTSSDDSTTMAKVAKDVKASVDRHSGRFSGVFLCEFNVCLCAATSDSWTLSLGAFSSL